MGMDTCWAAPSSEGFTVSKSKKPSNDQTPEQGELDNRADQLNPYSDKYWKARGYAQRPENWETLLLESQQPPKQDE